MDKSLSSSSGSDIGSIQLGSDTRATLKRDSYGEAKGLNGAICPWSIKVIYHDHDQYPGIPHLHQIAHHSIHGRPRNESA